ncbi:MAG TPA: type II toxin-antitoxin system VapC family toxin [Candidatus Limnocylindria bacterium]|nr:type II toxin-antitoxin system VapC family toxin [Candidatus Limnocylindria bacterium]
MELLLGADRARAVDRALAKSGSVTVPAHFDAEVYHALRRGYLRREIDGRHLVTAVDQLARFDAERAEIASLLPSVVGLADVIGAHDVFYVLLAISRGCPLLTCDLRLARAAGRLGVDVIAIDRARPS